MPVHTHKEVQYVPVHTRKTLQYVHTHKLCQFMHNTVVPDPWKQSTKSTRPYCQTAVTTFHRCHTGDSPHTTHTSHKSTHCPLHTETTVNTVHSIQKQHHQHHQRPWSTMEDSQPAAWTTNRSLHVVSHAKSFPGRRPTNSDSTLPRAMHLEGGVIGCLHLTLRKCFGIS